MNQYRIGDIKISIGDPKESLLKVVENKLRLNHGDILKWEIRRQSIDARDKEDVHYVYAVDVWTDKFLLKKNADKLKIRGLSVERVDEKKKDPILENLSCKYRPVIVGMGPCGIFAALTLAKAGLNPIVIERGPKMEDRVLAVNNFRKSGLLDPEANMLYGEGGAGTFSDGKLGTGIKDGRVRDVLETFYAAGAGDDILYLNKPHIGTDVLRTVIVKLREKIEALGGEIRFNTRLDSIKCEEGAVKALSLCEYSGKGISCENTEKYELETDTLILAIGHSARDTFAMINELGMNMEQKPFSIGVRMEHPQSMIDESQYGSKAISMYRDVLPPADYKISTKTSSGRGVYSFCMCPGGEVVVCSTNEGELCVNGMSNRKRDSGTANSGILCDVRCEDYNNGDYSDILAGVRFQRKYEKLAYENGLKQHKRSFVAPKCSMEEFLEEKGNASFVSESLPDFASQSIREAIGDFARKIKGYDNPNSVITAVETRSSSPIRILRDKNGESNIKGIYPAGEGAGYAGGITSAACDGIRTAEQIIKKLM